jgi:hypothetical protein
VPPLTSAYWLIIFYLKIIQGATEAELAECVEEDVVGQYPGDIEIVE